VTDIAAPLEGNTDRCRGSALKGEEPALGYDPRTKARALVERGGRGQLAYDPEVTSISWDRELALEERVSLRRRDHNGISP